MPGGYTDVGETWARTAERELWEEAISQFDPENPDIYLDRGPLFSLIEEIFDAADAIGLNGVFEGGPGMSSALTSYYAENPKASFENALQILQERLLVDV